MIRILIFVLSAIFLAGAITWFASLPGRFEFEFLDLKVSMHAGLAAGIVGISAVALVLLTSAVKDAMALPQRIKNRDERKRRERGVAALARGLEAVAVGDATDAQHHARVARRNLDDNSLTRLLTAQAAQLAGDDEAAGRSFTAMLDAPETEFLGLRGLFARAMRQNDRDAARGYAERAFKLRPGADWAFQSVFELGLERGAWGETREALRIALKNRVILQEPAQRAEAALLTADAYSALLGEDRATALDDLEASLKLAPSFPPAAVLAARLHHEAGRTSRGLRVLEQVFALAPHVSIVAACERMLSGEPPERRAEALSRLAARNPATREARLALARAAIIVGSPIEAIGHLEPVLIEDADARSLTLMAEAVTEAYGAEAGRVWLHRASTAAPDRTPGADGAFVFTRQGWAGVIKEFMASGRLAPVSIEAPRQGITRDDVKLLSAPPQPPPPPLPQSQAPAQVPVVETSGAPDPAAEEPSSTNAIAPPADDKPAA